MQREAKSSKTKVQFDLTHLPALLPQHSERMHLAGIHPLVARHRGYRSISDEVQGTSARMNADDQRFPRTRFPTKQFRKLPMPGILIPAHALNESGALQFRPDEPRIDPKTGKPRKYETPSRSVPTLDLHPFVQWALGLLNDPEVARDAGVVGIQRHPDWIAIVESRIKADALISTGIPAIGLQGVDTWMKDGQPLPDLDLIPWNGLHVVLLPDSNVTKWSIQRAFLGLLEELRSRGASVTCKAIPMDRWGKHQGPDDWLGEGLANGIRRTAEDVLALPNHDLKRGNPLDPEYRKTRKQEQWRAQAREENRIEELAASFAKPPWSIGQPDKPPKVTWAISQLHAVRTNTVMAGVFKARKTTFALNLARKLLRGKPFLGHRMQQIPEGASVAYLNFELDPEMFDAEALRIGMPMDRFARMHLRDYRLPITAPVGHDELVEFLVTNRAYWLIVDPFRRSLGDCGLHENDNDEVTEWGRTLDMIKREANCPNSLIIAHAGQDDLTDRKRERARGGTALKDWADNLWYLDVRPSGDRWLIAQHVRRGPEGLEYQLASDPDSHRIWLAGGTNRQEEEKLSAAAQAAYLCEQNPGLNTRELRGLLTGQKEARSMAIKDAVREGWITEKPGAGTAKLHMASKRKEWIKHIPREGTK